MAASRVKSENHKRAADDLNATDDWAHYFGKGNSDLNKAPAAQSTGIKKFLNPSVKETPPTTIRIRTMAGRARSPAIGAFSNLRCKLRQLVNSELLFNGGHLVDHFLETVFAEKLVLFLLEMFA